MAPRYDARDTYRCADERARSIAAAVLILVGVLVGCSRTTTGTVAMTTEPGASTTSRTPTSTSRPSDATLLHHHVAAYPDPHAPADSLTMTCEQYNDLDAATQQAVIDEIVSQEGSVFGPAERRHREDVGRRDVPLPARPATVSDDPAGRRHTGVALAFLSMGEYPRNYESLTVDVDGHVARVTLVGPGKGNAMGPAFWAELPEVFARSTPTPTSARSCSPARAATSATASTWPRWATPCRRCWPTAHWPGPAPSSTPGCAAMQQSITAVADCRTPVIASVHGWCIGGGVDLISAVDIRYASADAKFSVREVKLAIVADVGSLARLPLILSDGHLRELALTGKDIDAARAEKIGLVNDVYADAEASLAAAHATAGEIAANPPLVVQGVKDVLDEQRTAAVSASLRYVAAWNSAFLPARTSPRASPRCSPSGRRSSRANKPRGDRPRRRSGHRRAAHRSWELARGPRWAGNAA